MADTHALNYVAANRFYVEMQPGNTLNACFTECSGLSVNLKYETYFEGGVNDQQRIILGHKEFSDVTLKRGITDDLAFWDWATGSPPKRRNINILLFNQAGETMQCWTLIGAVPVSWTTGAMQADSSSIAIEELTLAYEGLNVQAKTQGGGVKELSNRDGTGFFPQ